MSRNKIFISHANPADNDFTKWLSLKLIGLGYNVWCDILFLDKGVDTWREIEPEIRENTCRFLIVLSTISNKSDGVLKELSVADSVKKTINDDSFIIPLRIDSNLLFSEMNIQLNRLNAIDFTKSWINGLRDLVESFEKNNIPKNIKDLTLSNDLYTKIFLHDRTVIQKKEVYETNWFKIKSFPSYIYFHYINPDDNDYFNINFPFPVIKYKNTICTFSSDIGYDNKNNGLIENEKIKKISVTDILTHKSFPPFIDSNECRLFLVRLVNDGFNKMMSSREFKSYSLSNKTGYWFEKGYLNNDKINNIKMVGKRKNNTWHFGISGYTKLIPFPIFIFTSHIFFTTDGKLLLSSKEKQHKLRIKQGKSWYNNTWRNKIISYIDYLANSKDCFNIPVGKTETVIIFSKPFKLLSHNTYISPKSGLSGADIVDIFDEDENEDDDT